MVSSSRYKGIAITTPGNIWVTKNKVMPIFLPGKTKREKAYAAVVANVTPRAVVATETTTELNSQCPNSQLPAKSLAKKRSLKLDRLTVSGKGFGDRLNACDGVSAILITHKTG
ncbi:MAG: hypothetical protein BWX66_01521 [Deltaproteobacteria bacterium ADurb.Bin058]|nr:MAG: hypothetical protein BWX66_01521 [Deltaproteobacteria bacterium ADurb.Bin058]